MKDKQGFMRIYTHYYTMVEKTSKNKKTIENLEVDAFDLLERKMNNTAINRLHKKKFSHDMFY